MTIVILPLVDLLIAVSGVTATVAAVMAGWTIWRHRNDV